MAIAVFVLVGCQDTNSTRRSQQRNSATARTEMNEENLRYAFSVLRTTEEFQTADALKTVVDRLNQWIKHNPATDEWHADPLVETLPEELRGLPPLQSLGALSFPLSDGADLQLVVWLNEIANRARGADSQPIAIAQGLFDWVVRNIQIERDTAAVVPYLARDTLILGRGTAIDRAWLFVLLGRQQGLEIVMLALPGNEPGESLRPWLPAVLVDGELYLFDTRLGMPLPGPDGKPVATLKDLLADEKLLRNLDVDEQRIYPVKGADLEHVTALIEGSPMYISRRMQLVGADLPGKESLVLTVQPSRLAERVKAHPHIDTVNLWPLPYQRIDGLMKADRETQQKAQLDFAQFQQPTPILWQARVLHLVGTLDGDKGANAQYQAARPPDADLKTYRAKAPEKDRERVEANLVQIRAAKQTASYWLGLVAYERGNYGAAIDYLRTRTLEAFPDGPWTAGARYNLARAYEAQGQTEEAIRYYRADLSAQRNGNLLRARRLEESSKPSEAAQPTAD
jgi:tetratricopeptide (TPR) repeat protein